MRGTILSYSSPLGYISGDDGQRYQFRRDQWNLDRVPQKGDRVDFEPDGTMAINIFEEPGTGSPSTSGPKSRVTAAILAILLGSFGVQFFYMGQWGWGLVSLLFCASGLPFFVGLVLGIRWLMMDDSAFRGKSGAGPFGKIPF
jgi:hypothetical protein